MVVKIGVLDTEGRSCSWKYYFQKFPEDGIDRTKHNGFNGNEYETIKLNDVGKEYCRKHIGWKYPNTSSDWYWIEIDLIEFSD